LSTLWIDFFQFDNSTVSKQPSIKRNHKRSGISFRVLKGDISKAPLKTTVSGQLSAWAKRNQQICLKDHCKW